MKITTWEGFDGASFQQFCNNALFMVVSKLASLYGAPGKDGGVDQYYIGEYGGYTGKWRFQDKFRTGEKKQVLRLLQKSLVDDIRDHCKDENFLVFITNLDLPPQEEVRLLDAAKKALIKYGKKVEVFIWHQTTLNTFVETHPILYNWHWETGTHLLELYPSYFANQLDPANNDLRRQLHNQFVGRSVDMEVLKGFLTDNDQTALAVIGRGGMGKTRLTVQFFKQEIDRSDEWTALVLKPAGFSAASFERLLSTQKKWMILVDDIHKYPELIVPLKQAAEKHKGRLKCLFTVRDTHWQAVYNRLPSINQDVKELRLKRLSSTETKAMYKSLLPGLTMGNLQYLTSKSKGIPLIIIAHAVAVRSTGDPRAVTEELSFQRGVVAMVSESIDYVHEKSGAGKQDIRKVIQLIALISPIPDTEEKYEQMATILEMKPDDVQSIIYQLSEDDFVNRQNGIAISADPFSDAILFKAVEKSPMLLKKWLRHKDTYSFLKNSIINLSLAGNAGKEGEELLTPVIDEYNGKITMAGTSLAEMDVILETIAKIVVWRPEAGLSIIRCFMDAYKNPTHIVHQEETQKKELVQRVYDVFRLLILHDPGRKRLDEFYNLLESFMQLTVNYDGIMRCFGYHETDFYGGWKENWATRQLYLAKRIERYYTAKESWKQEIEREAVKVLERVEFRLDDIYDKETMAIHYGTGQVRTCPNMISIRTSLVKGQIAYCNWTGKETLVAEGYFKNLAGELRFLFVPKEEGFDQTEELKLIILFLTQRLNAGATIKEKAQVKHILSLRDADGVKPSYKNTYQQLTKLSSQVNENFEKLELFLITVDYTDKEKGQSIKEIYGQYGSFAIFFTDVKSVLKRHSIQGHTSLHALIKFIETEHEDQAEKVFRDVMVNHPGYIGHFALLTACFYKNEKFFYNVVQELWNMDAQYNTQEIVLQMLTYWRGNNPLFLKRRDLKYFEEAIDKANVYCLRVIAENLYHYAYVAKRKTFELLERAVRIRHYFETDTLIYRMFEKPAFCKRFKSDLYRFSKYCWEYSFVRFNGFKPAIKFVHTYYALPKLMKYALHLLQDVKEHPEKHHSWDYHYQNEDLSEAENLTIFMKAFQQVQRMDVSIDESIKINLVRFFLPFPHQKTTHYESTLTGLITGIKTSQTLLFLAKCLQGRMPYNEVTLPLQCLIAEKMERLDPGFDNFSKVFGSSFLENRESTKTTVYGYASQEDVRKSVLLNELLANKKFSPAVTRFLQEALAVVEQEIKIRIETPGTLL